MLLQDGDTEDKTITNQLSQTLRFCPIRKLLLFSVLRNQEVIDAVAHNETVSAVWKRDFPEKSTRPEINCGLVKTDSSSSRQPSVKHPHRLHLYPPQFVLAPKLNWSQRDNSSNFPWW